MKDSTKLNERLLKYSAMAGVAVAVGNTADAQIVYHDVNPDVTVSTDQGTYGVDMDQNATPDFTVIEVHSQTGTVPYGSITLTYVADGVNWRNAGTNAVLGYTTQGVQAANALVTNDMIDNAGSFFTNTASNSIAMGASGIVNQVLPLTIGQWIGVTDGYVGVRFDIGGNQHYGWVRMDVAADGKSFTVKDHAYDATPNQPIFAGQMSGTVGIGQIGTNDVRINQRMNEVNINVLNTSLLNGTATVVNTAGQVISSNNLSTGTNTISLDGLAQGIYIVNVQFDSGVIAEKVFVR